MKRTFLIFASIVIGALNLASQIVIYDEPAEDPSEQPVNSVSHTDSISTEIANLNKRLAKIERDNENKRIWGGRGRFTKIGINKAQTAMEGCPIENGEWSFFLSKGATYLFPSNPIAGMIKVGFDAVWIDIMVSKYKSPYSDEYGNVNDKSINADLSFDEDGNPAFDYDLNLGRYSASVGIAGVGPNVSVAPFANMKNRILRPLRVSLYFHYQPTAMAYIMSEHGDSEVAWSFCNLFDFGGNIRYKGIAIGMEGKWGNGKFKSIDLESFDIDELGFDSNAKYKRRFANTRFYIQFAF